MADKNIVQAEFFPPVGILKTNVRFFDERGQITKLVKEFGGARDIHDRVLIDLSHLSMENQDVSVFETVSRGAIRKMSQLRGQAKSLVPGQLGAIIRGSRQLAVELPDRSFRMAEPDEFEDLLAKAKAAKSIWLFVFNSTDLLQVDGLITIDSMM